MNLNALLPVAVLATSLVPSVIIFMLPEQRHGWRSGLNLLAAGAKLLLVVFIAIGVSESQHYETRFNVMPGIDFVLRIDALAILFAMLSAVLWLFTTIYAIGYLEGEPNRSRFFGFFGVCVASTMGIATAGNLFTFLLFYELLTLSTYPLVVHRGSRQAMRAGRTYLAYTLSGGGVLMIGIVWLHTITGEVNFAQGAQLAVLTPDMRPTLILIFMLMVGGLAVKAAMFPVHAWLPASMVAPAPVSALLHAVAVVKAGAFGIMRVVYDVYGIGLASGLGVLTPLAVMAAITIIYGSVRALSQNDIKRRLAFSTISQVSYITLGICLLGPVGTVGGLVHLIHQGIMKITLFFCAGSYAKTLGIHKIDELDGVGKRMPATSVAFTLCAFGMIGIPPMAGFISKWYLGLGALGTQMDWVILVLVISSLLNSAYFLPVIYRLWFVPQRQPWPLDSGRVSGLETSLWLLLPTLATAGLALAAGLFAGAPLSPLDWVQLIVERAYRL